MAEKQTPTDIVYTWVDDKQPGYRDKLQKYAKTNDDLNPNRTRDNLDLLKFSLRSIEKFMPWYRKIFIVTCRPQIPGWLDTGNKNIFVVHHDEIMNMDILPTFNSFCIVSHLHKITGLSEKFIYFEDDMLLWKSVSIDDFITGNHKLIVYPRLGHATPAERINATISPWDMALAQSNLLLDQTFGKRKRISINRIPLLIDKMHWENMIQKWNASFRITRYSKFRSRFNVAPEYLYPYYMLNTDNACMGSMLETYRNACYLGLGNNVLFTKIALLAAGLLNPKILCLNDNFGFTPNNKVTDLVRAWLDKKYSCRSSFELQ